MIRHARTGSRVARGRWLRVAARQWSDARLMSELAWTRQAMRDGAPTRFEVAASHAAVARAEMTRRARGPLVAFGRVRCVVLAFPAARAAT